jgi:hypothetical protein
MASESTVQPFAVRRLASNSSLARSKGVRPEFCGSIFALGFEWVNFDDWCLDTAFTVFFSTRLSASDGGTQTIVEKGGAG